MGSKWQQEEERIRAAAIAAAEGKARELDMTEEEFSRALHPFEQQVVIYAGPSGRSTEEMQGACKEFVTVWGSYIDAGKTIPEGRRVPKAGACQDPSLHDMAEAVMDLGLPFVSDPSKRYPRDFEGYGRVLVELRHPKTGHLYNAAVPTRKALLKRLGEAIPALKGRLVRQEAAAAVVKAEQERGPAASSLAAAGGGGAGASAGAIEDGGLDGSGGAGGGGGKTNPKKKGKKKGRK